MKLDKRQRDYEENKARFNRLREFYDSVDILCYEMVINNVGLNVQLATEKLEEWTVMNYKINRGKFTPHILDYLVRFTDRETQYELKSLEDEVKE